VKKKHASIAYLSDDLVFPPVEKATSDGLLAVGGDLSPDRLLMAYRNGIFPWFNEDALILWWSPDPRMVLFPGNIKISKSMKKVLGSGRFEHTQNQCFAEVMRQCASIRRKGHGGTWITPGMQESYLKLHQMGVAKSYEVWENRKLVGGLYGIDLGHVFCGESMFSLRNDASKYAFIQLAVDTADRGYGLIDCQVYTPHLATLGAEKMARKDFINILKKR
jgi:leucyl/phenylalanyl-tRNA--protein transferase